MKISYVAAILKQDKYMMHFLNRIWLFLNMYVLYCDDYKILVIEPAFFMDYINQVMINSIFVELIENKVIQVYKHPRGVLHIKTYGDVWL